MFRWVKETFPGIPLAAGRRHWWGPSWRKVALIETKWRTIARCPTSLFPFRSKIIEKVVSHQITDHMILNNLNDTFQSAFEKTTRRKQHYLKGLYPARNREKSEIYDAKYNISGFECCRAEISTVANAPEAARAVHLVDHLFEVRNTIEWLHWRPNAQVLQVMSP